jgi:hypothetical protein
VCATTIRQYRQVGKASIEMTGPAAAAYPSQPDAYGRENLGKFQFITPNAVPAVKRMPVANQLLCCQLSNLSAGEERKINLS